MKHVLHYVTIVTVLLCYFALLPANASDADEQRDVAKRFITAYFTQDIQTVRECIPKNTASLFSTYPLTTEPDFAQPKVHETQALVEFTASMRDKKFPEKGGIVLHKSKGTWRVRQVLFYNKIPIIFGLPSRSVTREDRSQESKVMDVCRRFMQDWREQDTDGMMSHWHNWVAKTPDPIKGLSVSQFKAYSTITTWGDAYVSYSVKVTYRLGILSYSMTPSGGLILTQENGAWKVRASHFIFDF